MKNLTVNFAENKIEISSKYANAASKINSREFQELMNLKKNFPTFEVSVVKSSTRKANSFKGLTMEYMEEYIKNHDDDGTIINEFNTLCGKNGEISATASYGEIKMWFLNTYPEFEQRRSEIDEIINRVKRDRKLKKVA